MTKLFTVPFGSGGDKTPIPDATQSDGSVSMTTGYGADYARQLGVDPLAKDISRESFNQLLFDVTEAIRDEQAGKLRKFDAAFAAAIGGYSKGSIIRRDDDNGYWRCTTDANSVNPNLINATTWRPFGVTGSKSTALTSVDVTLNDAAIPLLIFTGTPTADINVILPSAWTGYPWTVDNRCTGVRRVTFKTASGTGVRVDNGQSAIITSDGTNIITASSSGSGSGAPVGTMSPFPVGAVPVGYLELDGSVQNRATYPDLFTYLGTTFNTGGETGAQFRLPETRGEFLRGWDHGRGIDSGRTIGSWQDSQNKAHSHSQGTNRVSFSVGGSTNGTVTGTPTDPTTRLPGELYQVSVEGGTEARPRNLAVMWCIKAWNAPVNQGAIDVAALVPLAAQATESNQGTAKVASQSDMAAGTSDVLVATAKKVAVKMAGMLSGQNPITPGSLVVVNHNLGAVPFMVEFSYVCITAEGGWSPGDVLHRGNWYQNSVSTDGSPGIFWYGETTTQVTIGLGSTTTFLPAKSTGLRFSATPANWRFIVRIIG